MQFARCKIPVARRFLVSRLAVARSDGWIDTDDDLNLNRDDDSPVCLLCYVTPAD